MSRFISSFLLALLLGSSAQAQDKPAPAVQSTNIMDVKPDAAQQPGYAEQTNGERAKVQPGNNAPMWRDVGKGVAGYSSLPVRQAPEAGVLIQPFVEYPGSRLTNAGEAWRQVRNNWIIPYGGSLLFIVVLAIAIFYWSNGTIRLHGTPTGREIERFTPFERSAHWSNAIAFVVLAVSGLVMAFGKFILQPVIGDTLFGWLTYALKNAHNFAGPLFAVSLVVVFFTFVKDNLPAKGDLVWLLKGGGMLNGEHVPSGRFNAGEKSWFWFGVVILGAVMSASGLVLLFPNFEQLRSTMQTANVVHGIAAVVFIAMSLGHIYVGTIGMEGAYQAMKTGYVDETWAKEHHELWADDIAQGKIPAHRSPMPQPTTRSV